ncbi:hypothetical protein THAOC_30584, partial [Thalassiosira oceanica]
TIFSLLTLLSHVLISALTPDSPALLDLEEVKQSVVATMNTQPIYHAVTLMVLFQEWGKFPLSMMTQATCATRVHCRGSFELRSLQGKYGPCKDSTGSQYAYTRVTTGWTYFESSHQEWRSSWVDGVYTLNSLANGCGEYCTSQSLGQPPSLVGYQVDYGQFDIDRCYCLYDTNLPFPDAVTMYGTGNTGTGPISTERTVNRYPGRYCFGKAVSPSEFRVKSRVSLTF